MTRKGKPRLITYNDKTQSVSAWSRELGVSHQRIFAMIKIVGDEKLALKRLTIPSNERKRHADRKLRERHRKKRRDSLGDINGTWRTVNFADGERVVECTECGKRRRQQRPCNKIRCWGCNPRLAD